VYYIYTLFGRRVTIGSMRNINIASSSSIVNTKQYKGLNTFGCVNYKRFSFVRFSFLYGHNLRGAATEKSKLDKSQS
jgi:hypothetical protein